MCVFVDIWIKNAIFGQPFFVARQASGPSQALLTQISFRLFESPTKVIEMTMLAQAILFGFLLESVDAPL